LGEAKRSEDHEKKDYTNQKRKRIKKRVQNKGPGSEVVRERNGTH